MYDSARSELRVIFFFKAEKMKWGLLDTKPGSASMSVAVRLFLKSGR